MKKYIVAAALLAVACFPALAKNLAVPTKDPVATITIPDTWKTEEITYGYSAKSPDGDVFFSVEYASGSRLDKMLDNNTQWMKDNKIVPSTKEEREITLGGLSAKLLSFKAKDENGDTKVDFVFIDGGKGRLIMLTLWASEEEMAANANDISAIQKSIKAIN
jgi:hypothetical protein